VNYAAFGAFIGAGQTCICGSRQIVHARIYDEFVEKLAAKAKTIRIGNPGRPERAARPVVSARQQQRVLKYIEIGLKEDRAPAGRGGKVPADPSLKNGFFVEPTVFADVTPQMRIFQEEVFGPFVSVSKFSTEEKRSRWPTTPTSAWPAAIRTSNVARAHRVAARLKCGIVWVNDHHRLDPRRPGAA
jgi:acyl-CoA reductase-like NAD-dependent aldehyde dehydrogenase